MRTKQTPNHIGDLCSVSLPPYFPSLEN
uniref:Uncharacterized protein n=1 Tax=Arundo donax TaxID=35708 RepID=A0A0A9G6M1_ARUDO